MKYSDRILNHYEDIWENKCNILLWDKGPVDKLPPEFRVLEFAPTSKRDMWTYSTCCMSQPEDQKGLELHLFSSIRDLKLVELLTSVSYFHRITQKLDLNHTVNFGKPWQDASLCSYGLISLPYLDGPTLENLELKGDNLVKFYWLIPITQKEVEYKIENGVAALETKLENVGFNYVNAGRISIV